MGPYEGEVTQLKDNGLLASRKNAIERTIPVAITARIDGGTLLPKGTVLAKVTDDLDADYGLYKEYDNSAGSSFANGQEDPDTAVVLKQPINVDEGAAGETKVIAAAYIEAVLKPDKVVLATDATMDWAAHATLSIWPQG
jgi:hypothetical protein